MPFTAIAAAVSGRQVDERPVNREGLTAARCVYGVEDRASPTRLRRLGESSQRFRGPPRGVRASDCGCGGRGRRRLAITDKDTKRIQVTARLRGKVTVQATSDRMDRAQAVARVALSKF